MTTIERFLSSTANDPRFNLPFTGHNNPWIYGAYADLVSRLTDGSYLDRQKMRDHFRSCEVTTGLFNRWPDGSGGQNSHDEIEGAAYFDPWIAQRILQHMSTDGWLFNNRRVVNAGLKELFDMWQGRFLFLGPYLRACANYDVTLFDQLLWCSSLMLGTFGRPPGDCGGRLRNWLQVAVMSRYKWCKAFSKIWCAFVGMSPPECFATEPGDYPVFATEAKNLKWESALELKEI